MGYGFYAKIPKCCFRLRLSVRELENASYRKQALVGGVPVILVVSYKDLYCELFVTGIPLANIAWACDLSRLVIRDIDQALVIKIHGNYFRIGFSTMSPQTVKGLIRARARGTK
jgi:hypothetical protein